MSLDANTATDPEAIASYVNLEYEAVREGWVEFRRVAVPKGIGKRLDNYDRPSPHIRGVMYANLLVGTNYQKGAKPKLVYVDSVRGTFFERVERQRGLSEDDHPLYAEFKAGAMGPDPVPFTVEFGDQVPDEFRIDWGKMADKVIRGPMEPILDAAGIPWGYVQDGTSQSTLGEYGVTG